MLSPTLHLWGLRAVFPLIDTAVLIPCSRYPDMLNSPSDQKDQVDFFDHLYPVHRICSYLCLPGCYTLIYWINKSIY